MGGGPDGDVVQPPDGGAGDHIDFRQPVDLVPKELHPDGGVLPVGGPDLHGIPIRAYIVFALALNYQALTQKSARYHKVQEENEKFAMRVYLNRIGFIGDEFKSCREHLYKHLDGNAAWRYGSRENVRSHIGTHHVENGGNSNGE